MPAHDPVVNPSIHYLGVEGTAAMSDHAQCAAQWARIQSERSDEYGPLGAYNFGGCVHGERFVGRGWDMDSAANGGENGIWYNAGSRALCLLVGTDDEIPPAAVDMVRAFANEAVDQHGMEWPLRGHSEFVATSCPGDHLRGVISEVNANHDKPTPPSPPIEGHDTMDMLVGKVDKATSVGPIPVPANQDIALLVQGNCIIQTWGGDSALGVPKAALAWRGASNTRAAVNIVAADGSQLQRVIDAHNKLFGF